MSDYLTDDDHDPFDHTDGCPCEECHGEAFEIMVCYSCRNIPEIDDNVCPKCLGCEHTCTCTENPTTEVPY